MRILHFIYDHPANIWVGGGGARRAELIGCGLAERGHFVRLVCGRYPGARDYARGNLSVTFIGSSRGYVLSTLTYALAGWRLARREARAYDLLIEDFAPWNPLFTYRIGERPAMVQVQNRLGRQILRRYPLIGLLFYAIEHHYPQRFAHAVVINQALNDSLGLNGEVISMGIDEELLGMPAVEGDYVAFLGRLDFYQKGLDLLLRAARLTRLPLRIAGDGPGRRRLQGLLPSVPSVIWVGHLEGQAKIEFLRQARFVVVPSRFEGQNLVVLEAAALGKALLVSDVPELAYAVRQGFAVSFRAGVWQELADRLQELWNRAALRQSLAQRARPSVKDLTWSRITDQFERCCLRIVTMTAHQAARVADKPSG
jgi:glycosyltransferase involved in cell wall biosynthesis